MSLRAGPYFSSATPVIPPSAQRIPIHGQNLGRAIGGGQTTTTTRTAIPIDRSLSATPAGSLTAGQQQQQQAAADLAAQFPHLRPRNHTSTAPIIIGSTPTLASNSFLTSSGSFFLQPNALGDDDGGAGEDDYARQEEEHDDSVRHRHIQQQILGRVRNASSSNASSIDPDMDSPLVPETTYSGFPSTINHGSSTSQSDLFHGSNSTTRLAHTSSDADLDETASRDDGGGDDDDDEDENSWSDSETDSDESTASTTDGGAWYSGHGVRMTGNVSRNSSNGSRLVNLDEELAGQEQSHENTRHFAKQEAQKKKKQREQNQHLPCPPCCGVSWGIHGQLVYFSNLPLLTHYLVTNQRRRQKPGSNGANSDGTPVTTSALSTVAPLPLEHIDHDEEENSYWAGASASSTNATSASSPPLNIDEVLPRTYADLLQLPFVAAHLGYVVGEDMEAPLDETLTPSDEPTPILGSRATSAGNTSEKIGGREQKWMTREGSDERKPASSSTNPAANTTISMLPSPITLPELTAFPITATASPTPMVSSASVLDLATVDLDSVTVTGLGRRGPSKSKLKGSSSSLATTDSGTQLDQLTDTYDILDEDDLDVINTSSMAHHTPAPSAGSDDFFASLYNTTVLAVGAVMRHTKSNHSLSGLLNFRTSSDSTGAAFLPSVPSLPPPSSTHPSRPLVPQVPPLPPTFHVSFSATKLSSSLGGSGANTPRSSSGGLGGLGGGLGGLTPSRSMGALTKVPSANQLPTMETPILTISPEVELSAHSWTALSLSVPSNLDVAFTRRRIKINTSIIIMDCQDVLPCSTTLAREYSLSGSDSVSVCLSNQHLCERVGRFDLAETWQLAAIMSAPHPAASSARDRLLASLHPWNEHPMGGRLAEQLIQQYLRVGDIQTVAMLVGVFSFHSSLTPLLPSRPRPTIITVQETEGVLIPAPPITNELSATNSLTSTTATVILSPENVPPSPSNTTTMTMPSNHPMALLPPNTDGSSRTWTPGSRGALTARAFAQAAAAIKSNYSSGNASPMYNTNSMQRAKWRHQTDESGSESSSNQNQQSSRVRSISFNSARGGSGGSEGISRIEEDRQGQGQEVIRLPTNSSTRHTSMSGLTPSASSPAMILGPAPSHQIRLDALDLYLYIYAEYLYRIGEYATRAKLLKFLHDSQPEVQHCLTGFTPEEQIYGLAAVCVYCRIEQKRAPSSTVIANAHTPISPAMVKSETPPLKQPLPVKPSLSSMASDISLASSASASNSNTTSPSRVMSPSGGGGLASPTPGVSCVTCNELTSPRCDNCHHYPLQCSLCHISVRGLYLMCVLCGHGGHPAHMNEWFNPPPSASDDPVTRRSIPCPTACGCHCVADGGMRTRDPQVFNGSNNISYGGFIHSTSGGKGGGKSSSRRKAAKKELELREAVEAAQKQHEAAQLAAVAAAAEEEQQGLEDPEHSEQLQHFYNPAM